MRIEPILMLLLTFPALVSAGPANTVTLWYRQPACNWNEALPVGNGRMGAMVFGGVTNERIQFNEQTLWTGTNASQKLTGHNTGDGAMGDYQPFGDVFLRFPAAHGARADYRRELDLHTAIATTRYRVGEVTFTREVFASHPDRVVVIRLTADKPASLSFGIALKDVPRRQLAPVSTTASEPDRQLSFTGKLSRPAKATPGDLRWNNLAYHAALRVLPEGGQRDGHQRRTGHRRGRCGHGVAGGGDGLRCESAEEFPGRTTCSQSCCGSRSGRAETLRPPARRSRGRSPGALRSRGARSGRP